MGELTLPVFAIKRHRMQTDGEGVTTLVGSRGCPLHCRYCINPYVNAPILPVRELTVEQLLEELCVDALYFSATNGGVTFGGGESLIHASFLSVFAQARPAEWTINLETCVNVPEAHLRMLMDTDARFIVDCKSMKPEIYTAYTGADPKKAYNNLALLGRTCPERVHVRVPLIPYYNTNEEVDESVHVLREMGFSDVETFRYVLKS